MVAGVHVGTCLHKDLDDAYVVLGAREVQRRPAVAPRARQLGVALDEEVDDVFVSLEARDLERRKDSMVSVARHDVVVVAVVRVDVGAV